jgi:hypothetical protein
VGFQFTLNELRLSLVSEENRVPGDNLVVNSRPYKNANELDLLLMPGKYALVVELIKPSAVWTKLKDRGDRCVPFTFSITVDDASRGGTSLFTPSCRHKTFSPVPSVRLCLGSRTDCSQYHVLPLSLDEATGVHSPFGGPMRNGYVHISSDKFLAAGLTNSATKATDTIVRPPLPPDRRRRAC